MRSSKFIDRVRLHARAGNGGDGRVSFRREKFVPLGGPDGGDGARGGSVIIKATHNVDSLIALYYKPLQRAGHGGHGGTAQRHGRNGEDLILPVPPGTEVYSEDEELLGEVVAEGEEFVVAQGGRGGLGNIHFKTSTHQAPRESTPGTDGEEAIVWLVLKTISDVGLVGYPNAGKSTLLSALSNAHPKIAPYPFTTLNPIMGTVDCGDYQTLRIADIPGLIDGAHRGVGLGHDFLRHIERTSFLVFVIDMAGCDGRDPAEDYLKLREELKLYRKDLPTREHIIVANKMDLPDAPANLLEFQAHTGEEAFPISAKHQDGLEQLVQILRERVLTKINNNGDSSDED
jgi:GTPase